MFSEGDVVTGGPGRVQIHAAENSIEAHALANYLGEHDVQAFVDGDSLGPLQGPIPFESTRPTLLVKQLDADRAQQLVSEWTARRLERRGRDIPRPFPIGMQTVLANITALAVIFAIARLAGREDVWNIMLAFTYLLLFGNWMLIAFRQRQRRVNDVDEQ